MPRPSLLFRTAIFCAVTVTIVSVGVAFFASHGGGLGISKLTSRLDLRSGRDSVAPFVDRFAEASASALRPYATGGQIDQAKTSLANALIGLTSNNPLAPQPTGVNPPIAVIPVPRARPSEDQFAQSALTAPSSDQPRPSTDDAINGAIQKVLAFLQPSGPQLASLAPDGGVSGDGKALQPGVFDKHTAVYDMSGKLVYMPDGRRLEAHSGLGEFMDDPRYIAVKDRGPTPPNIYELKLREKRFHGVQAIRMRPTGNGDLFGRTGLLTHSYLMGPKGDSNGCVSFKDYDAFLQAFLKGDVRRLLVVKTLSDEAIAAAVKA